MEHACPKQNKTKIKIKKWLGIPDIERNETFLLNWHKLKKQVMELLEQGKDDTMAKELNMYLLNLFYVKPYDVSQDFYLQFETRRNTAEKLLCQMAKQEG